MGFEQKIKIINPGEEETPKTRKEEEDLIPDNYDPEPEEGDEDEEYIENDESDDDSDY